jgi:uncharacterized protein involved in exopolysaccharide biosynthesis
MEQIIEQTRQQIREILAANADYTQMKPLLTLLRAEVEKDMKANHAELEADMAKIDANEKNGRQT